MVHQILHGGTRIARHRLTSSLDQPPVTLFRAGDSLWSGFGLRFRHAGQSRLGESVNQRVKRLLSPTDAEDIARQTIKACSYPFVSAGQLGSPIQFVADRSTDKRAGICVAPGLRCLLNLMLFFSGEADRDSGVAGCAWMFRKKGPLQIRAQQGLFGQISLL